jgi:hypothetical protein
MLLPKLNKAERAQVAEKLEAAGRTDLAAQYRPQRQRPEGNKPVLMTQKEFEETTHRLNRIVRSYVELEFKSASGFTSKSHYATQDSSALLDALDQIVSWLLVGGETDAVVVRLNAAFDRFSPETLKKLIVQHVGRVRD